MTYHIFGSSFNVSVPQTINNLSNLRCRSISKLGKMWKWTTSTIYWISNKANTSLLKSMKYHTCWWIGNGSMPENDLILNLKSNLLCPIRPRKPNSARALETVNAVMGTLGIILPISDRYQQILGSLIMATSRFNCATVNRIRFGNIGTIMPIVSWRISSALLNIKTVFPRYGDSHVKDKTVGETVLSLTWESLYW